MYSITQSKFLFESGSKDIRVDSFCQRPREWRPGARARLGGGDARSPNGSPAVIALHGSGGGHASMAAPASLLAEQGFAVCAAIFDRTGTTEIDGLQTIFRFFPPPG